MKYTIIDTKKNTIFIQQHYDLIEDANKRLGSLKEKFGKSYSLAVVGVDNDGNFHKLTEKAAEKQKAS